MFRFGVFELDSVNGELRKSGVRLRLQDQPLQVLLMFVERAGEVVTREELRQRLWPADTFVDFDHSLNTIVNKLRETLGDSATSPRFIETLAKRGYRFLAPVQQTGDEAGGSTGAPAASQGSSLLTDPAELPTVPHGYVRVLFLLIQVMYLSFYIVALARIGVVERLLEDEFWPSWIVVLLVVSASIGVPLRFYLLSGVAFDVRNFSRKFQKLFPAIFVLDELWALSPFLLAPQIGLGLALGVTAALIYVPFAERTLLLMRDGSQASS